MRASLAIALLALCGGTAHAACNVTSGPLSFGPYDPLSAAGSATSGVITVTCDQSPPPIVTIQISPSAVSGGFFPRRMQLAGGSDKLDYNLYVDPGATTVWGDGTGGTATQSDRVTKNTPWNATIYALMPGLQDVTPGNYGDTIGISIIF
jgi:spore coat protein U domain-containing protein, fimbrial subunit CupE1/2/3/6